MAGAGKPPRGSDGSSGGRPTVAMWLMRPRLDLPPASLGIPPSVMRDVRRTRGAYARVRCGGASLTAKLALAGKNHKDADPAVLHAAPPLLAVAELLWDFPRMRHGFIYAWRAAVRATADAEEPVWDKANGPVIAAYCHVLQLGIKWVAPFRVDVGEGTIADILEVPPRQLYAVIQDRARVHIDKVFLRRIARQRGWNEDLVMQRYGNGVDWEYVRMVLNGPSITAKARRALEVVTAGAFWSDERRWLCNYTDTPGCTNCNEAVGDDAHFYSGECGGVHAALVWEKVAGRPNATSRYFGDPSHAPLTEMLLPPRLDRWEPVPAAPHEGFLSMCGPDKNFGDGSGYRQRCREHRIATFAVVRLDGAGQVAQRLRGVVLGFSSTVPRAEATALIEFLRHAPPGATYYGDCKHVIDISAQGVAPWYVSSRCRSADLWRQVRALLRDREDPPQLVKVKAHVSRGQVEEWEGDRAADAHCKELARTLATADAAGANLIQARASYREVAVRITFVAEWAFGHREQFARGALKGRSKRQRRQLEANARPHTIEEAPNGRWRCSICRREAWTVGTLRALRESPCDGHLANQCDSSHELATSGGVLWCTRCGAYTSRRPRALRFTCPGRPTSAAA